MDFIIPGAIHLNDVTRITLTMIPFFSWVVVILILFASGTMLVDRDWRVKLAMLAVQYLAASWLITRHQPFAMGAVKLVTGWMIIAALGMTRLEISRSSDEEAINIGPHGYWYPIILMSIAMVVTAGATPRIEAMIPGLGFQVIAGSLLLITSGFIHLGTTADVFRVVLGLLVLILGFETIYAAVESSILVAGLLAITNLAMGLVGCYLLLANSPPLPVMEEEQL